MNPDISRAAGRALIHAYGPPSAPTPIDPKWLTTIQVAVEKAGSWDDLPRKVRGWIELHDPEAQ